MKLGNHHPQHCAQQIFAGHQDARQCLQAISFDLVIDNPYYPEISQSFCILQLKKMSKNDAPGSQKQKKKKKKKEDIKLAMAETSFLSEGNSCYGKYCSYIFSLQI